MGVRHLLRIFIFPLPWKRHRIILDVKLWNAVTLEPKLRLTWVQLHSTQRGKLVLACNFGLDRMSGSHFSFLHVRHRIILDVKLWNAVTLEPKLRLTWVQLHSTQRGKLVLACNFGLDRMSGSHFSFYVWDIGNFYFQTLKRCNFRTKTPIDLRPIAFNSA